MPNIEVMETAFLAYYLQSYICVGRIYMSVKQGKNTAKIFTMMLVVAKLVVAHE